MCPTQRYASLQPTLWIFGYLLPFPSKEVRGSLSQLSAPYVQGNVTASAECSLDHLPWQEVRVTWPHCCDFTLPSGSKCLLHRPTLKGHYAKLLKAYPSFSLWAWDEIIPCNWSWFYCFYLFFYIALHFMLSTMLMIYNLVELEMKHTLIKCLWIEIKDNVIALHFIAYFILLLLFVTFMAGYNKTSNLLNID